MQDTCSRLCLDNLDAKGDGLALIFGGKAQSLSHLCLLHGVLLIVLFRYPEET